MADYSSIVKDLRSNTYAPVYFLQGEEPFFIDSISAFIEENTLEESQKRFNLLIMYGKDTTLVDVVGAAKSYPMMGDRQVVIVKEAQGIKDWKKEKSQKLLLGYLENPMPGTILVFAYKDKVLDQRTKLGKAMEKSAVLFNSKKIYDNQIPDWITSFVKGQRMSIDRNAVMLLAENIGNNPKRIASEVEKLSLNMDKSKPISVDLIQKYIGISKEYNNFELQKAIGILDKLRALKIVRFFGKDPKNHPSVLVIATLYSYFSKLLIIHAMRSADQNEISRSIGVNPYFVKEYQTAARNFSVRKVIQNLQYIHEADLTSKGISSATVKEDNLLIELVYKLMN